MSKSGPESLKMHTANITSENVEKIAEIFPNVITEIEDENDVLRKGVDFDLLRQELSNEIIEGGEERYEFTWVGKKRSMVEANLPIRKTLRPCTDESLDWENTRNIYIEGDNLDALKLLQESYLNSIKMIYIDPPYNTGNDFIYNDKFVMDEDDYDELAGTFDEEGNYQFKKPNSRERARYHSDWCSMLYPRLKLAHKLLNEHGVIFISIDDNEVDNLKKICNDVFGEENFVSLIALEITKTQGMKVKAAKEGSIVKNHEYILCYTKSPSNKIVVNVLYDENEGYDTHFSHYINKDNGELSVKRLVDVLNEDRDIFEEFSKYNLLKRGSITIDSIEIAIILSKKIREHIFYNISKNVFQEMACNINIDSKTNNDLDKKEIVEYEDYLLTKSTGGKLRQYSSLYETLKNNDEYEGSYGRVTIRGDLWKRFYPDMMNVAKEGNIDFKNGKKPIRLIYQLGKWIGVSSEDIILDFFSGSATTAHAVMKLNAEDGGNRRYIMVQLPEACKESSEDYKAGFKNISEIGKERIRRAGDKIKKEIEEANQQTTLSNELKKTPDIGFRVFKIDETNMKDVYYAAGEYSQETIEGLIDNVKSDRSDLDLLYQVLIDWGLLLDLKHEMEIIDGFTIHIVDSDVLIACFDSNIPENVMRKIAERKPLRAVFRDGSFKTSPEKLNIEGIFKTVSPDTKIRVI